MEYFFGALLLAAAGWYFLRRKCAGKVQGDCARKFEADVGVPKRGPTIAPVQFDVNDPSIGNPRDRMKVLGWNQVAVLNHAAAGLRVFHAEPGQSHSEDAEGRYFYQPRTVNSLISAGFLEASPKGGYVITPLGFKALHTLPERSN